MLNLYLAQHAESQSKDEDPDRPLTDKGWRDAREVAVFAGERQSVNPKTILHSGKTRARQTAEVFAESLSPPGGTEATQHLEPMADPSIWAGYLTNMKDDLMLVGHLPHLSKLTALLLCGDQDKDVVAFHYSGMVALECDDFEKWSLKWMVTPALLLKR